MGDLFTTVLSLFFSYLNSSKKRKQLHKTRKLTIDREIQKNKWILAHYNKMRIQRNRSCWVTEALLRSRNRGFWELKVPYMDGKYINKEIFKI